MVQNERDEMNMEQSGQTEMNQTPVSEDPETTEAQGTSDAVPGDVVTVGELQKQLEKSKKENDETINRMLRLQADFDNFRRRSKNEYEQILQYAGEDVIKKILPVLDSLERAVGSFPAGSSESWQEGVQLTLRQFQDILGNEGLEPITALNAPFDPQVHEAVFHEESDSVAEPTVIEELRKGYKFRNKLIRASLVKVAAPSGATV